MALPLALPFSKNFWSLLDWARPLMCGLGTTPITLICMKLIHMCGRENTAQLIKVLWLAVQARIWHLFTTVVAPCQRVVYWLCYHFRQKALSKLVSFSSKIPVLWFWYSCDVALAVFCTFLLSQEKWSSKPTLPISKHLSHLDSCIDWGLIVIVFHQLIHKQALRKLACSC